MYLVASLCNFIHESQDHYLFSFELLRTSDSRLCLLQTTVAYLHCTLLCRSRQLSFVKGANGAVNVGDFHVDRLFSMAEMYIGLMCCFVIMFKVFKVFK